MMPSKGNCMLKCPETKTNLVFPNNRKKTGVSQSLCVRGRVEQVILEKLVGQSNAGPYRPH